MEIENILNRNFSVISDKYREFALAKDNCRSCSIYNNYKHVGQSEGNAKNPLFMFIGEALGQDEITEGRPFVGKAGQRLRKELRKYPNVFNKDKVIITNTLGCRPLNNQFPYKENYEIYEDDSHRTVYGRSVVSYCVNKWLLKEISILNPKIIVLLGAKSLENVLNKTGITSVRGSWINEKNRWYFPTFHPSYVLRCENIEDKHCIVDAFDNDIKTIAESYARIISEQ